MHVLRNLNKVGARGRILGTPKRGTFGSDIPAGSAIRDLNVPTDDGKEYSLRLLTWPASGSLFMYEDGTSVFIPAADGTYTATGQIAENGIDIGSPVTITYQSGVASTTVACSVGAASATGAAASVQQGVTIACTVGTASAAGASASVQRITTVACGTGNAAAAGQTASVSGSVTISCSTGAASASGLAATITSTATGSTIACGLSAAGASGAAASIYQGMTIAALVGNAMAAGASAGNAAVALIPNAHQIHIGSPRVRLYTGGQMSFSPKRASEEEIFSANFAGLLAVGETIKPNTVSEPNNVLWTITTAAGEVDANVSAMIQGAPTITGAIVSQMLTAGIPGVRYAPICTVRTSLGQKLVLPEYGQGQLEVTL